MKVFVCTLLCFFSLNSFSEISEFYSVRDSSRKLLFTGRANVIFNRSFSHQIHGDDSHALGGYYNKSTELNSVFLPGFELAGSVTFKSKGYCHFFLETSYSLTQGLYKYSMGYIVDDRGPVFKSTGYNVDCKVESQLWNLGAGLRWRIAKRFSLATNFNFNYAFGILVHEKGIKTDDEWTFYTIHPSAPVNYSKLTVTDIDRKYWTTNRSFSFRLSAGYDIKKGDSGILAFRNFGMGWKLPWWGIGYYKNF